jgi:hypothetical protein
MIHWAGVFGRSIQIHPIASGLFRQICGSARIMLQVRGKERSTNPNPGGPIRTFVVSLLGAAVLTAGIFVFRHQREADTELKKQIPAGENTARTVSLEKLRELGL